MSEEAVPQKFQRLHLWSPANKKLSGKGIRYVELSLSEMDAIELDVIRSDPELTRLAMNKMVADSTIETSIRFVTKDRVPLIEVTDVPAVAKTETTKAKPAVTHLEPDWANAQWEPTNAVDLKIRMDKIFTRADRVVLRSVFAEEYNVTQQDMDSILLGKATELLE